MTLMTKKERWRKRQNKNTKDTKREEKVNKYRIGWSNVIQTDKGKERKIKKESKETETPGRQFSDPLSPSTFSNSNQNSLKCRRHFDSCNFT